MDLLLKYSLNPIYPNKKVANSKNITKNQPETKRYDLTFSINLKKKF